MRKTVKRTSTSSKHECTFHCLHKWYEAEFEKLGWMILAKAHGMHEKVHVYKTTLGHLKEALETKLKSTRDSDKKADIKIMWENLNLLIDHVNKDFP